MFKAVANAIKIEPVLTGNDSQFVVTSDLEITHILKAIMREAALITATIDVNEFFLTSILAIDEKTNSMLLERGRSRPSLSNALGTRTLSYSTTLDKVRIQFTSAGIEAADHSGIEAYRIPLPAELLRIQRREHYRIPTPVVSPVKCRIFTGNGANAASADLHVCDISCGGIAVQSLPALFTPELGTCYECIILLPGTSGLRIRIQARNAFMVTLPNGKIMQRSGFAFVKPPENILATIQRYILGLERQHRTRSGRDG